MGTVLDELRGTPGRAVRLVDGLACQLSPRELDVLLGLGEGLSTAQVSARLGIGIATARGYLASALKRLEVQDRSAAIALVSGRPPGR